MCSAIGLAGDFFGDRTKKRKNVPVGEACAPPGPIIWRRSVESSQCVKPFWSPLVSHLNNTIAVCRSALSRHLVYCAKCQKLLHCEPEFLQVRKQHHDCQDCNLILKISSLGWTIRLLTFLHAL